MWENWCLRVLKLWLNTESYKKFLPYHIYLRGKPESLHFIFWHMRQIRITLDAKEKAR